MNADRRTVEPGETPKLDAVFDYHEKMLALGAASQALASASARYQALTASTWWSTWMDYTRDNYGELMKDAFTFVDKGLAEANEAMLKLHHSDAFLATQRDFISNLTRFRQGQRDVAEIWQTWAYTPTQRDVDEMAETLYELRREVRRLRRQIAGADKERAA